MEGDSQIGLGTQLSMDLEPQAHQEQQPLDPHSSSRVEDHALVVTAYCVVVLGIWLLSLLPRLLWRPVRRSPPTGSKR